MIVVRIMGGLGNQMFQYAVGKRLATSHDTELKIDISYFKKSGHRQYLLNHFSVPEDFAAKDEIRRLKYAQKPWWLLLSKELRQQARSDSQSYIREKYFHINEGAMSSGPDAYLDGFWQSEQYFKDIEDFIRKTFTFQNPSPQAVEMANRIRSSNSVSLHVRRGDYIKEEGAFQVFETLSQAYYRDAVDYIRSQIGSLHVFVFSDNMPWVRENMSFDCQTTMLDGSNSEYPLDDLYLMSLCRHNIVANSSFSWWGAWLNSHENKKVVAPSAWFRSREINTRDLIPEGWKRI